MYPGCYRRKHETIQTHKREWNMSTSKCVQHIEKVPQENCWFFCSIFLESLSLIFKGAIAGDRLQHAGLPTVPALRASIYKHITEILPTLPSPSLLLLQPPLPLEAPSPSPPSPSFQSLQSTSLPSSPVPEFKPESESEPQSGPESDPHVSFSQTYHRCDF